MSGGIGGEVGPPISGSQLSSAADAPATGAAASAQTEATRDVLPEAPRLLDAARANGWTLWHAAAVVVLVAIGVYATRDGWVDLLFLAVNDPESSHILLVPLVAGWLLWLRRDRLAQIAPSFSLVGPMCIALGWGVYEWGYYENIRVAGHIAAIALLVGAIVSVGGGKLFWRLLPVFGVLLFAIPVPYRVRMPISIPLQRYTAQITEHLMQTIGVEVTRQGSVLTINAVDVGVAEACNGMRMVFAVFLVTYLFAFLKRMRTTTRLALLVAAPLIALACNILRLVPTVILYGHSSHDVAEAFHDLSGWAVIVVAFFAMLGTLKLFEWMLAIDEPGTASPAAAPPSAGGR